MANFFDTYTDVRDDGESTFLSKEEKQLLINERITFPITTVSSTTTEYGPRWVVGTEIEGEPRMIGFSKGKVFSRDRLLAAIEKDLEDGGDPAEVYIKQVGRSQILKDARLAEDE